MVSALVKALVLSVLVASAVAGGIVLYVFLKTESENDYEQLDSLPKKIPNLSMFPSLQCPGGRNASAGERIFLTVDDGPSTGREFILNAFDEINSSLSFYDSGYQLCNDLDPNEHHCESWAYEKNIKLLARTVKSGHYVSSHSDNHYFSAKLKQCNYNLVAPDVRPESRLQECGKDPAQNMVQGAHQIQMALESSAAKWESKEDKQLRDLALRYIWEHARLPCSNIWRSPLYNYTNLYGVDDANDKLIREKTADSMFSEQVKCRPSKFSGKPWHLHGWDDEVEIDAKMIDSSSGVCEAVKMITTTFDKERNSILSGKVVMLTHGYYFNGITRANMLKEVAIELLKLGYELDTMDHYFN